MKEKIRKSKVKLKVKERYAPSELWLIVTLQLVKKFSGRGFVFISGSSKHSSNPVIDKSSCSKLAEVFSISNVTLVTDITLDDTAINMSRFFDSFRRDAFNFSMTDIQVALIQLLV